MNRRLSMSLGVLFLMAGMLLTAQSTSRLRADPPYSVCPYVDISFAKTDCAATSPCEGDNANETNCLKEYMHWTSEKFPLECLKVEEKRLCNKKSYPCRYFLVCKWDKTVTPACFKDPKQGDPTEYSTALKFEGADCPP